MVAKAVLMNAPKSPGVYIFKKNEDVIYVGKAKSLRKRILSYFQKSTKHTNKKKLLIKNLNSIDWIICKNEVEALLTEANLIKQYKPYYNVLLKDDKTFPFIRITKEPFPKVEIVRIKNLSQDENIYFGPYTDIGYLRDVVRMLHRVFKLRTCTFYMDEETVREKKHSICLDFHINKCGGPCEGFVSTEQYNQIVKQVIKFLKGDSAKITEELSKYMIEASNKLDFELAMVYRDQIDVINSFLKKQKKVCQDFINRDVVTIVYENKLCVTVVMKIRNGNLTGVEKFELKKIDPDDIPESLRQFLIQYYYDTFDIPDEVLVNSDLNRLKDFPSWIKTLKGKTVSILNPKKGVKSDLIKTSLKNAQNFIKIIRKNKIKRSLKIASIIEILKNDLNLSSHPLRIEAFDISHISGSSSVGAMVCFINGKKAKREYRKYSIKTVKGIDDFASIREIITRRYSRALLEKSVLPDLILIDGGKGQLSAAKSTLDSLGLGYINIIGLAKRLEEVYIPDSSSPQNIKKSSPSLLLLRKIRDEVHRFAITYHKKMRDKKMVKSKFSDIKGVGEKCIQMIWEEFNSLEELRNSSEEEISKKLKISIDIAKKIKLKA